MYAKAYFTSVHVLLHYVSVNISALIFIFHFHFTYNFFLLNQLYMSHNFMPRTIKLRSTVTYISSFQTERVHGSAFNDQIEHLQTLVPMLKYVPLSRL